jgi:fatty-acyl-CoA synthase
MLKVGGENVDPMEVEGLLLQRDGVQQVAIVGYPDRRLAEIPVAFVVAKPGCAPTEEALIESCRGKVASFKIPRRVIFLDALPMTASGKVRKEALRELALQTLGAG